MIETITKPVPVETVTPIKPSEALRLGRVLYPTLVKGRCWDGASGACAIGAMAAGYGWEPTHEDWRAYEAIYGRFDHEIGDLIVDPVWSMNDDDVPESEILAYLESLGM